MIKPKISIVIPTYNSERILEKVLKSLERQTLGKNFYEILIIDGGSTDKTLQICSKFKCKVINNSKISMVPGKNLGLRCSKAKYVMFLDSDEVLYSNTSLVDRLKIFKQNKRIKAVLSDGYRSDVHSHPINQYVNEYGDPFSYFVYRESKDEKKFNSSLAKKYNRLDDNKLYSAYKFEKNSSLPLIELWAGGSVIDKEFIFKNISEIKNNESFLPHIFYALVEKGVLIGISKNDPVVHYSCHDLKSYLIKLRSRVENNIFNNDMGKAGYLVRSKYDNKKGLLPKQYLFVIYTLSIIIPLFDSIKLWYESKKTIFLFHWILCIWVLVLVVFFESVKFFKLKYVIPAYGK